ncbi:Brain-specific angiogenesis inhibitor 3 [Stylophora pistillata]|uniref:Brain-specific angiogenesis inhibitor 3 n=1 Tax=Stylophora pistillata TaxID=50429 RepID=A0A2B4RJ79_STYPI|nr:Brain-specific angiogenesis inhibitor 3 [Stylophora pistillata]
MTFESAFPATQAHTCQPNLPKFNVTLRAGSASGVFWKLGRVKDVNHCGQLCCQQRNCDLAFSVDDFCYNVECQSEKMCRLKNENFSRHNVAVTLITRSLLDTFQGKDRNKKSEGENNSSFTKHNSHKLRVSKIIKNKYESDVVKSYQSKEKETEFELQDSFPTKTVVRLESKLPKDGNIDASKPNSCRARRILHKVTLRSGLKSGDFSDYGQVPDINVCVKHCCEQKTCDVSLLLNSHCYTLRCYKPELCKIIPAHESKLDPQLAFVTRSTNGADEEKMREKRVKKKTSTINGGLCLHGAIFSGVSLKGGYKAGKFELLPGAKDMHSCIQKCCASQSCQVAWLLGDHCYSVSCFDKCITVRKPSKGIQSQLTLLTGKPTNPGNEKRQGIPGSKVPSGKVYKVFLTLTDQVFSDRLKDIESLEFLNLAEKLQVAVSSVFVNVPSYKTAEVISFQSNPVMSNLKLTASEKSTASEVLTPLVAAVKSGQLKSSIDGTPLSFSVSDTSFRFITSTGVNLVCSAVYDYDINWRLMMFNTTDNQTCPRKAQGQTRRFCAGSEISNATWHEPNFSECVTPAYKNLHKQSKDLATRAENKEPFTPITASEVIAGLEKLVFTDTYREEIYNQVLSDQQKNIRAAKRGKGKSTSKVHDKVTFVKPHAKNSSDKEVPKNVPVTEIPRRTPEILPTVGTTEKTKNDNAVWFSDLKTKLNGKNPDSKGKSLNFPTASVHLQSTPAVNSQSIGNKAGIPVEVNRIPTRISVVPQQRVFGAPGIQTNAVSRSQVQYSNGQRQINLGLNRLQPNNPPSLQSPLQRSQLHQSSNPQVAPGYAHALNPYRWLGSQAWQNNRAQGNWGRGYSPPSYLSDQLDIGRRKRESEASGNRTKRQNTLWYTSHQNPSQLNYLANQRGIPSTSYQQPRNYFQPQQHSYQSPPNQAALNPYQRGYMRQNVYHQSLGMGRSPAGQQPVNVAAPNSRSQVINGLGYGTQPGIGAGGQPTPVERWPNLANPIQSPAVQSSQNSINSMKPSSESRTKLKTNQILTKNIQIIPTTPRVRLVQPTNKVTNKAPMTLPISKEKDVPVHTGQKKVGSKDDLSKKLQDISGPAPHFKTHDSVVPLGTGKKEEHVVPMFGGDILLSVGILQQLQKFTRLSKARITEKDLKLFVNASSHILDLKNKQEWNNAQKHAEVLFKRGINVLEDSSNWDWDESQQMTSKDDNIRPVILDLVKAVQDHVMNASYSVSNSKPLITKNILVGLQTFSSDSANPSQLMTFPNYSNPLVANWSTGHDSITMAPTIFDSAAAGINGQVHLMIASFKTVPLLLPIKSESGLVLNSAVFSSTVKPAVTNELIPPVKIVLSVSNASLINYYQECVAWTAKEGQVGGKWSSRGCKLTGSNATHTTCECNHMTDFAVMANTKKEKGIGTPHPSASVPSPGSSHDRSWIGILVGILAVLVLIIIVVVFLFYWRKRRREQGQGDAPRPRPRGLRRSRSLSRSSAKPSRSSSSKSDGAASPASSHSSQFDEMIAARRRRMAIDKEEKARRAQEEGDEIADDDLLMKEKAMLFSDYHQPYHFLSKEDGKRATRNRREQPGSSGRSPPGRNRRSATEQDGDEV